jgi:hypothetical protein
MSRELYFIEAVDPQAFQEGADMQRLGMVLVPPHGIRLAVNAGGLCLAASCYVPPWAPDNPESTDITELEVKAFNGDGLDAGLH